MGPMLSTGSLDSSIHGGKGNSLGFTRLLSEPESCPHIPTLIGSSNRNIKLQAYLLEVAIQEILPRSGRMTLTISKTGTARSQREVKRISGSTGLITALRLGGDFIGPQRDLRHGSWLIETVRGSPSLQRSTPLWMPHWRKERIYNPCLSSLKSSYCGDGAKTLAVPER